MLRASTRARGAEREIRRVASMPFSSGIATSMTTTSGSKRSASSTASRPVPASPTTSMSCCESSISRKPCRTIAWSSANKIRIFLCMVFAVNRYAHFNLDSIFVRAPKRKLASGASRARAHPDHSHPLISGFVPVAEASAVIRNGEADIVPFRPELNRNMRGAGMPRNIGQSFLANAEKVSLRFIGQPTAETGAVIHGNPGALRESFCEPAQAFLQAEVVEDRRMQELRNLAHISERLVDEIQAVS